jgi:hypothetical protein
MLLFGAIRSDLRSYRPTRSIDLGGHLALSRGECQQKDVQLELLFAWMSALPKAEQRCAEAMRKPPT